MLVLKQFRRIWSDDGRNDKSFKDDEAKLQKSLQNLKNATNQLILAANEFYDMYLSKEYAQEAKRKLH